MDKKSSSLKLKLMKTPKTLMVAFTFVVSVFSFEIDYIVPARKVYFPKNARLFFNSTTQNFPDVLHQPDILCIFIGKNAWFGLFSASLGTPAQKQAE